MSVFCVMFEFAELFRYILYYCDLYSISIYIVEIISVIIDSSMMNQLFNC